MGVNLNRVLLIALLAAAGLGITGDSRLPTKSITGISRSLEDKLKSAESMNSTSLFFENIMVDNYHPIGSYGVVKRDSDNLAVYSNDGNLVFTVEPSSHYFKKMHGKKGYVSTTLDGNGRVQRKIYFHSDQGEQYRIFLESVDFTETFNYEKNSKGKSVIFKHTEYDIFLQTGKTISFSELPDSVAKCTKEQFMKQYDLKLGECNVVEMKHVEISSSFESAHFNIVSSETTYVVSTPFDKETGKKPKVLEIDVSFSGGKHQVTGIKYSPL